MSNTLVKKTFFSMLVPTILTNLISAVGAFSDTVIVGNLLGETALSAVTFTSPVFMFINTVAILFAVGGATAMNIDMGRGDRDCVNKVFTTAITTVTLIGIVLGALCVLSIDGIVRVLGANEAAFQYVKDYAAVLLGGFPVILYNTCIAFYVRSDGRAKLSMTGMMIAIFVNIVLDMILVPLIGIAGAAWALVIAQGLSGLIISTHFFSKKNTLRFAPKGVSFKRIRRVMKSGASTSMTFICQFFVILIFNNLIVSVAGTQGMVVFTVISNISMIALSVFEGMSQTIQPMVSVYYGEENNGAMQETMKTVYKTAVFICGAVILFLELFPQPFVQLFGVTNSIVLTDAVIATRMYAPVVLLMTLNVLMSYFYQSTEKRLLSGMIVLSRSFILLLASVLALSAVFGLNGVWLGYLLAELLTLLLWTCVSFVKSKKDGVCKWLLLKKQPPVFERVFEAQPKQLRGVLIQAQAYLQQNHVESAKAQKAILAIETLVTNVILHGSGGKRCRIEVRLSQEEKLRLIIRDNGKTFDPAAFENKEDQEKPGELGIYLVKNTADFFEYRPTLGVNRTMLKY